MCAPSQTSSSSTARPSPLLAAATMATRPVSPRSIPPFHSNLQSSRDSHEPSISAPLLADTKLACYIARLTENCFDCLPFRNSIFLGRVSFDEDGGLNEFASIPREGARWHATNLRSRRHRSEWFGSEGRR